MRHKKIIFGVLISALFLLSACKSSGPDQAVAAFWQALVAKDSAQVSSLSCAAYEPEAQTTLESFNAVETKLKDLSCTVVSQEGETAVISCSGSIVATYGAEDMTIDLSARTYTAKKEGGDWRMCGAQ
jgi:hypothetical protein